MTADHVKMQATVFYHDSLFLKSARSIFSSLKPILYLALVKNFFLSPTVTEGNFAEFAKHWKK